jgi:hypothetical protein
MTMAETTFDWTVVNMERRTADDVVYTVHWTVTANDGTYSASGYGSIGLELPDEDSMIPFADLTAEIVIGWTKEKLDVEQIEAALVAQLNEIQSPSKATGMPWMK